MIHARFQCGANLKVLSTDHEIVIVEYCKNCRANAFVDGKQNVLNKQQGAKKEKIS